MWLFQYDQCAVALTVGSVMGVNRWGTGSPIFSECLKAWKPAIVRLSTLVLSLPLFLVGNVLGSGGLRPAPLWGACNAPRPQQWPAACSSFIFPSNGPPHPFYHRSTPLGSVLHGTILNYLIYIGHYRGQLIRQPIKWHNLRLSHLGPISLLLQCYWSM